MKQSLVYSIKPYLVVHGETLIWRNLPSEILNLVLDLVPVLAKNVVRNLNQGSCVMSMDFHPMQQTVLLVGTNVSDISIWEVGSRERLASGTFKVWDITAASIPMQAALVKDPAVSVNRTVWSPDGILLGVAFSNDGYFEKQIDAHVGGVNDLAFSHPNKQLCVITCGDDKTIKVWEAATGRKLYTFEGHEAPVYSVCPHHKEGPQRRNLSGDAVATTPQEDDDIINSWNLQKCSAAGLDILSTVFGDEILPVLMPLVQVRLSSTEDSVWEEREAAILALGAVAEGCITGLLPHLTQIVAYLISFMEDVQPLVRSISCWTLSRYSKWIVQVAQTAEGQAQFDAVLTGLLQRILDSNKRVQEATCSAFATLEEDAAEDLAPRLEPIL